MKKFEISYAMSGQPVVHVQVGRSDEVLIPRNDWDRPEWREAVLSRHPEIDPAEVDAAMKRRES